jgi:hypothetical protein
MAFQPSLVVLSLGRQVVLSWPLWASDYVLEHSDTVSNGSSWNVIGVQPATIGGSFVLTNLPAGQETFYRLRQSRP